MLVAAVPDDETRRVVLDRVPGVEPIVWDWRTGVAHHRAAEVVALISAFSSVPPTAKFWTTVPALRLVQLTSAGYDGWLSALPSKVLLCNGSGVHSQSTAEAAIAGVLALLRRLPQVVRQQDSGAWLPVASEQLGDKRVAVIGGGSIGLLVAGIAAGFGCPTIVFGRIARDGVLAVEDLSRYLSDTDVIVFAVPLTEATRGMAGARLFSQLPNDAIVVNISRGPVVATSELVAEVRTGRLRAYLDVTDPEPLPPDHELWKLPGMLISPHTGGGENGWQQRYIDLACTQLQALVDGTGMRNIVTPVR